MATVVEANGHLAAGNGVPDVSHNGTQPQVDGLLSGYLSNWSGLQISITILLVLMTYDQGTPFRTSSWQ